MGALSKSKIMAFRQCPKRLWLEVHRPELRADSLQAKARFQEGHAVGEVARIIYDPKGDGALVDAQKDGFFAAFEQTRRLVADGAGPIFEAAFSAGGALALADVLLPSRIGNLIAWRMVEVKSATSVKDSYREDVALQSYVARCAGVNLTSVAVAHVDNRWVYPGGNDYRGLLVENDLTEEAIAREAEVRTWIDEATQVARRSEAPDIHCGSQCRVPYECSFLGHCTRDEVAPEMPIRWLPRIQSRALKELANRIPEPDMRDVPDDLLTSIQLRVKQSTVGKQVFFDAAGAAADLSSQEYPAYFLDFETIRFAVPRWKGTRPFELAPFQFSLHIVDERGAMLHKGFLDLTGDNPSRAAAESLLAAIGSNGPVFAYYAQFEKGCIEGLAKTFPDLAHPLHALSKRLIDLLPIVRDHYYHPNQHGSWSIKDVLPTIAPDLRHDELDGVQNGEMAMSAYTEAVGPNTLPERREEIRKQLWDYCCLDTLAMVRVWEFLLRRA